MFNLSLNPKIRLSPKKNVLICCVTTQKGHAIIPYLPLSNQFTRFESSFLSFLNMPELLITNISKAHTCWNTKPSQGPQIASHGCPKSLGT